MYIANVLQPLIDAGQWILEFWHDLIGDFPNSWGWAIILMTFTVRIAILPLTFKGVKSMQRLQTLQPEIKKIQDRWERWGVGIPLIIIDSPYRELIHPLLRYIEDAVNQQSPDEVLTVVVPEFVPKRWWHNFLHTQTATILRWALLHEPGVVVVDVPYQVP